MTIRPTTYADIEALMAIFDYARAQMATDGNPLQWGDGYPSREQLESDIQRGVSYVIEHNGQPCATFVFIIGKDPTYAYIEDGNWLDDTLPYGTIHRIASNGEQRGIIPFVLHWCSAQCGNIRIDTHHDNKVMQRAVLKYGFRRSGIIYLENGDPRIAYDLLVEA
jgi:hypothetical protein